MQAHVVAWYLTLRLLLATAIFCLAFVAYNLVINESSYLRAGCVDGPLCAVIGMVAAAAGQGAGRRLVNINTRFCGVFLFSMVLVSHEWTLSASVPVHGIQNVTNGTGTLNASEPEHEIQRLVHQMRNVNDPVIKLFGLLHGPVSFLQMSLLLACVVFLTVDRVNIVVAPIVCMLLNVYVIHVVCLSAPMQFIHGGGTFVRFLVVYANKVLLHTFMSASLYMGICTFFDITIPVPQWAHGPPDTKKPVGEIITELQSPRTDHSGPILGAAKRV